MLNQKVKNSNNKIKTMKNFDIKNSIHKIYKKFF